MKSLRSFDTISSSTIVSGRPMLAKFRLLAVAALAVTFALSSVPQANAAVSHILKATAFETAVNVNANCNVLNCVSPAVPMFAPLNYKCAGAIGVTCTFYIHLETDDALSNGDMGIFQFLVGGVPPLPGPTFPGPVLPGGDFIWDNADPASAIAVPHSHSYAVTATVTNTIANEVWPIVVNLACQSNADPAGCTATTFLANLEVGAYTP
jgi:hypothetical protein